MPEPGTYFLMPYNTSEKCTGLLFLPGTSMQPVIARAQEEKRGFVPCTGFPILTIFALFSPLFPSFPLFLPLNLFTGKEKDGVLGTYFSRSQSQSAFTYVPGYVPGSKKPGTQGATSPVTVRDLHVPGYVPGSEEQCGGGGGNMKRNFPEHLERMGSSDPGNRSKHQHTSRIKKSEIAGAYLNVVRTEGSAFPPPGGG